MVSLEFILEVHLVRSVLSSFSRVDQYEQMKG